MSHLLSRWVAKDTFVASGEKLGLYLSARLAVRTASPPVSRSLIQISWFPDRAETNTILRPSAESEGWKSAAVSRVNWRTSPVTLPVSASIGRLQMSVFSLRLPKAIFTEAAAAQ